MHDARRFSSNTTQQSDAAIRDSDDSQSIDSNVDSDYQDWWPEEPAYETVGKVGSHLLTANNFF